MLGLNVYIKLWLGPTTLQVKLGFAFKFKIKIKSHLDLELDLEANLKCCVHLRVDFYLDFGLSLD